MAIDDSGTIVRPNPFFEKTTKELAKYIANDDPEIVKKAKFLAFYKGKPVIKIDKICDWFYGGKAQASSFGVIFIDSDRKDFINDLNHEYGHTKQFDLLGPVYYTIGVAIPSLHDYFTIRNDSSRYYNEPQEITADLLGEVSRSSHTKSAIKEGWDYLNKLILNKLGIGKL